MKFSATIQPEPDTEPRELDVPPDLAAALDTETRQFFDCLSRSRSTTSPGTTARTKVKTSSIGPPVR